MNSGTTNAATGRHKHDKEGRLIVIAVDGPAASGKGTLARRLARHYHLHYLDTGLLYRAVARDILNQKGDLENVEAATLAARHLDPASLDDPSLRTQNIGKSASIIARIPTVRNELLTSQREFASTKPGAILDGRDIGTVVCPDADVKIFVTATQDSRAMRRYLELKQRGKPVKIGDILDEIKQRDERDQGRDAAPLKQAEDAHLLDTTNLDIETSYRKAVDLIDNALACKK